MVLKQRVDGHMNLNDRNITDPHMSALLWGRLEREEERTCGFSDQDCQSVFPQFDKKWLAGESWSISTVQHSHVLFTIEINTGLCSSGTLT